MPQFLRDIFGPVYRPVTVPILHILAVVLIAYAVLKFFDSALKRLHLILPPAHVMGLPRVQQRTETLRQLIRSVIKAILILFIAVEVASELGYAKTLAPVLASAGIAGLAVGFGAQSLVKDVISGFFIVFEDQFGVGDVVKIGDFTGVVEHMTLRATVLRNLEGQVYVIPNGNIQHVTVMTKEWARAVLDVMVPLKEELSRVFKVLESVGLRLAEDFPDRISDRPQVLGIEKLEPAGLTIRCIAKTPPFKQADVLREWRRRVKEEFDRNGIEFVSTAPAVPATSSER
jgi:small conductance mechanosensitive channel